MEQTRLRRLLLTATVALLVATAGCSGLTGDDGNSDGVSGSGYDVAGSDLDGQTLTDATSDTVESAGSFTVETTSTFTTSQGGQEQTSTSDSTLRVNLDDDRGIRNQTRTIDSGDGTREQSTVVYTDGSTSYRKQTAQGETSYDQQDGEPQSFGGIQPVNTTAFAQNYTGIVDGFAWEQSGSSEVDGVAVTEYSLTGEPDRDTLGLGENATIEDASGTLYVDSDGAVRQADIAYTVTTQQGTTSIDATTHLSNVGSTTVEEPSWLSEAT
ncbi:MAG: hypothetical protein V5A45_04455 [Haloarculaceae archaeon]